MSALSKILRDVEGGGLVFMCPGCGDTHLIYHGAGPGPRWKWNGDVARPTFCPSVLVRCGCHVPDFKAGDDCWCTYNAEQEAKGEKPSRFKCGVCHSFVKDGQIQFLGDCTHALSGQTVPLPEWTEEST